VNLLGLKFARRLEPKPLSLPLSTVPVVYVLPVRRLSLPILNVQQLSRFSSFCCLRFSFAVVSSGD
jgi:hypothetical protein